MQEAEAKQASLRLRRRLCGRRMRVPCTCSSQPLRADAVADEGRGAEAQGHRDTLRGCSGGHPHIQQLSSSPHGPGTRGHLAPQCPSHFCTLWQKARKGHSQILRQRRGRRRKRKWTKIPGRPWASSVPLCFSDPWCLCGGVGAQCHVGRLVTVLPLAGNLSPSTATGSLTRTGSP